MNGPELERNKSKGIIVIVIMVLAVIAIIVMALKYSGYFDKVKGDFKSSKVVNMTKSSNIDETVKVAYDGYLGYAVLDSKKFKTSLEADGIALDLLDDQGDYPARVKNLSSGKIDIAVMPIHDYLEQMSFMGIDMQKAPVIIGALSLSTGSDAVMVNPKVFASINDMKGIKNIKAAYTSKFMLGSMAVDTGVTSLLKAEANNGIEETYNGLINGSYDVVGLWEPYITKAKEKGFKVLMGSQELKLGRIIDVVIVNREFILDHSYVVEKILKNYYESVSYYNQHQANLLSELELKLGGELSKLEIEKSIEGVRFYDLSDNVYTLFKANSSSKYKVLDYIDAVVVKLQKMQSISSNPIPNGDSRNIVYNDVLTKVSNMYDSIAKPKKEDKIYNKLSEATWSKLIKSPKFSRDDLQISFMRDGKLDRSGKSILDAFATDSLSNYDYYIAIVGKSAKVDGISEDVLVKRTTQKAEKVYKYLQRNYQIKKDRIKFIGAGSSLSPFKKDSEGYYSYLNKNNKVEILFIDY